MTSPARTWPKSSHGARPSAPCVTLAPRRCRWHGNGSQPSSPSWSSSADSRSWRVGGACHQPCTSSTGRRRVAGLMASTRSPSARRCPIPSSSRRAGAGQRLTRPELGALWMLCIAAGCRGPLRDVWSGLAPAAANALSAAPPDEAGTRASCWRDGRGAGRGGACCGRATAALDHRTRSAARGCAARTRRGMLGAPERPGGASASASAASPTYASTRRSLCIARPCRTARVTRLACNGGSLTQRPPA